MIQVSLSSDIQGATILQASSGYELSTNPLKLSVPLVREAVSDQRALPSIPALAGLGHRLEHLKLLWFPFTTFLLPMTPSRVSAVSSQHKDTGAWGHGITSRVACSIGPVPKLSSLTAEGQLLLL